MKHHERATHKHLGFSVKRESASDVSIIHLKTVLLQFNVAWVEFSSRFHRLETLTRLV